MNGGMLMENLNLFMFNPRIEYILENIKSHKKLKDKSSLLKGLNILDIGY